MPAEKTTAIVLKVVEFSESSCVVTLYTRDFGKISALAKGARRLRSPFDGAIDLLSICRIVFLRKSVDSLDLLTEARLLRRFRSASTDLSRLYAGMYVIELVAALTDHADAQPALFDWVVEAIESIDSPSTADASPGLLFRFELTLLSMLGHVPALFECVDCGRPIDDVDQQRPRVAFGMQAGGVYCEQCRSGKRNIVGLTRRTLQLMRETADTSRPLDDISWDGASRGELRGLLDQYIADLIGYRPRMQNWLKQTTFAMQDVQTEK